MALLVAATGARAIDDPALATRTKILDNGLTVLTLEDPSTPVVSFQMWVKAGSRDESRVTGLAHLFLGSNAERVVQHAPCPGLTVKPVPED